MSMSPMIDPTDLARIADGWQSVALGMVLRGTILLALCGASALLLRRTSAATRHLWWTAAVVGVLFMPLLSASLPSWELELPSLPKAETQPVHSVREFGPQQNYETTPARLESVPTGLATTQVDARLAGGDNATVDQTATPSTLDRIWSTARAQMAEFSTSTWLLLSWELGALLVLTFFAAGRLRLWLIERNSVVLTEGEWVDEIDDLREEMGMRTRLRVLQSRDSMTPMTWGAFRPVILIPKEADEWDPAQRRDVLVHELHHVRRHDCLSQTLAQIACVLYWFHPLVWFAAGRMRDERERACDDQVLMAGSKASSYASHLLEMARSLRAEESTTFASVAMARRSQLSDRLVAVLDPQLSRVGPSRRRLFLGGALAAGCVLGLAVLQPVTAAPPDRELHKRFRVPRAEIAPPPRVAVEPRVYAEPQRLEFAPRAEAYVNPVFVNEGSYAVVAPEGSVSVITEGTGYAYTMGGDGHGSLHIQSDDDHSKWTWSSGSDRIWIEADGEIEFNDDDSDVASISEGGYFEIGRGKGRRARHVEIEADEDGNLTHTYFEGRSEKPFDDSAKEWLSETLDEAIRQTGIGADVRATRIYKADGLDAVLSEIDGLESDHVRKQYFSALLGLEELNDDERQRVLGEFAREVSSDYERAQLLLYNLDEFMANDKSREAYFDAVDQLGSDYERSRVLRSAFERHELTAEQLARVLHAAEGISSDYERSRILKAVSARELADQGLRDAYFRNVEGIHSDYERSQVLQQLLDEAEDDPELAARILKAVLDVDSDYERAQVLVSTSRTYLKYPELHDLYFDAVEEIDSNYERGRVLLTLMEEANLDKDGQMRLIQLVGAIDSDYERTKLLIQIANIPDLDAAVFEALGAEIDRIDNDHEYGKAVKALRKAERQRGS
jgi:beta-lactamase regulating signal transducer with metallopeptidase domain